MVCRSGWEKKGYDWRRMIEVSAPGKLMLLGEHAVVYGRPCLVTAVDRRLVVGIEKTHGGKSGKISIDAPQVNDTRFVERALEIGLRNWHMRQSGLRVVTESPFSGKYGFGSSAAAVVATLAALAFLFGRKPRKRELFDLAYQVVLAVQGVGSGFDVAAAIFGGTLYFIGGGQKIEELKTKTALPLVVGYTGMKSSSVQLIQEVARKRELYPERVSRIFTAIARLVEEGKRAYLTGDWEKMGKLMDFNQEYLRDLGVSSPKLEELILAAKKAGAWGAKLSGAGGGDCMIALASSGTRQAVRKAITEAGGEVIDVSPNAEGARVEL